MAENKTAVENECLESVTTEEDHRQDTASGGNEENPRGSHVTTYILQETCSMQNRIQDLEHHVQMLMEELAQVKQQLSQLTGAEQNGGADANNFWAPHL